MKMLPGYLRQDLVGKLEIIVTRAPRVVDCGWASLSSRDKLEGC